MAKKYKKAMNWIAMIIGLLVALAIGGLFAGGELMNIVILKWLPLIVHQVVGWIIIIGAVIKFIADLI